jgi:hypothetical protein
VPPLKAQKVDINATYPCPCRQQGQLSPIALTEAFGCQRCQQIFVLKADGVTIEQLSTTYPYKRAWYWDGDQWQPVRKSLVAGYWLLLLGFSLLVLTVLLLWTLFRGVSQPEVWLWVTLIFLIVALLFLLLLAYRH